MRPSSLLVFCFVFVYVPSSLCNIFFFVHSFFLFFLSLLSLFLRLLLIPPSHQIQSTPQGIVNRSSDSHTHIRKINSHSRLLKVKISSLGVLLGDCRVLGFATSVCRFTLFSTHSLIASSMQASSFYLSAVSHWW